MSARVRWIPACALALLSLLSLACARGTSAPGGGAVPAAGASGAPQVGPARGSVLVVGGGAQGPETFAKFIELAGGPDALIVEVPTASGDSVDTRNVGRGLRAAGARNVVVLHTTSRAVADADSFVAKIAGARGVWFGGGRHYRLVDSYAGTRTARAFEEVLARGGVVGGSSAGASILASYLVRGAPSNDNRIMNHPKYLTGFGYLRGVAIDQHVVARDRLADLHDSLTSRRPDLLGISEDEGTAWVVQGDTGTIIGRGKAFVYGGRDANDPGRPFLTLLPGDRYDLRARRVISRAIDAAPLRLRMVDGLFTRYANDRTNGGAAVLVAQEGRVLVSRAYGIPMGRRFTPETAIPVFALGDIASVLTGSPRDSVLRLDSAAARRAATIGGAQRLLYDHHVGNWKGNVDDLYRVDLGRFPARLVGKDTVPTRGFAADRHLGLVRHITSVRPDGRRGVYMRYPERRTTIIVLTNDDGADARGMADQIAGALLGSR